MNRPPLFIKLLFVGQMLGMASIVSLVLFIASGAYETKSFLTIFLPFGPLAGSGILAVIVSEIADKRREKKNEDKIQKND